MAEKEAASAAETPEAVTSAPEEDKEELAFVAYTRVYAGVLRPGMKVSAQSRLSRASFPFRCPSYAPLVFSLARTTAPRPRTQVRSDAAQQVPDRGDHRQAVPFHGAVSLYRPWLYGALPYDDTEAALLQDLRVMNTSSGHA